MARLEPVLVVGSRGEGPGHFRWPRAVAVDPAHGEFYVVDRSGRIQRFDAAGGLITWWRLPDYQLGQPVGLALEARGTLLVNDSHYQRILRYGPDGREILACWGSAGTGPGQFTFGRDVAVDGEGNVYAGDYGGLNDRILKFSPRGEFLLEWGSRGAGPGQFDRPQGMAIERRAGKEYLLVADCSNHRIQRFELDGTFVSTWGSLGTELGQLRYPSSVAVGTDGSVYVSEWGNNRVQKFTSEGRPLGVWGGPGRAVGELATPWDVALGSDDRLFVVDYGNHRVQVVHWPAGEGEGSS
jgi:DNA-binding beta-propeller fold protein YncE